VARIDQTEDVLRDEDCLGAHSLPL
jgi:hypothetical protein